VGMDEPRWATQPLYARKGMAQTRACSRVCRSVFAFVVTLIDSNLSTTPAEEIPQGGETVSATPVPRSATPSGGVAKAGGERSKRTAVRYGKDKGRHLCDIDAKSLDWQLTTAQKSVAMNDPKWHQSNCDWLALIQEEVSRRSM
jgi:hypothetical protein